MSTAIAIGRNIKAVRAEKGMTQREVCDAAEISPSQLSTYENGRQMVGLVTLGKIAKALNTSIDRLYFGSPSEAFLNESGDFGETVANCFKRLWELGVIDEVRFTRSTEGEAHVCKCSIELQRLFSTLKEFDEKRQYYPEEAEYLAQLYKSVSNEIDARYTEQGEYKFGFPKDR